MSKNYINNEGSKSNKNKKNSIKANLFGVSVKIDVDKLIKNIKSNNIEMEEDILSIPSKKLLKNNESEDD